MDTYEVIVDSPKPQLKYRLLAALLFGGTFFVLRFGASLLWPTSNERSRGLIGFAIEIGAVSIIYGVGMGMGLGSRTLPNYKLLVDEDSITGITQYTGWMRWLVLRRTVRRNRVRSIFEMKPVLGRPGGIGISERSILGARVLGFVSVPKTLPEFDRLRNLSESWRIVGEREAPSK